ncbi:MAG TPA: lactate utilization protein [Thermoanaerobaculaceae bacterium]|nr:lactate utilization protein [Thermoanaerobaculaceae bacterium]
MYEAFRARAEAVSAEVHRVATRREALDFVADHLRREGVSDAPQARAVWADDGRLTSVERDGLAARAPGLTFAVTKEAAADSRVGVSEMTWGLADTGSVFQDATDPALRLVSTLPPQHVALLRTDRIIPDLPSLLARVDPRSAPYLSLITGPSRTADIERVLTIGVHGPERLIVVCYDGGGE